MPTVHRRTIKSKSRLWIKPRPVEAPVVEEPEKSPWQILLAWFRQESFYREITTRALSIAVVALVAYLYAVSTGYVAAPERRPLLYLFLVLLGGTCLAVGLIYRVRGNVDRALTFVMIALAPAFTFYVASIKHPLDTLDPFWATTVKAALGVLGALCFFGIGFYVWVLVGERVWKLARKRK